jgi:hypothetical protein
LAQKLLETRLNKHGYSQSTALPGLWTHKTHPISFTLVINDFGIKYVGKEHALHLSNILKENYKISEDWSGTKFIRLTFEWDYAGQKVHLSMPGYIPKALTHFQYPPPVRIQNSPHKHIPPTYGPTVQFTFPEVQNPLLDKADKNTRKQSLEPCSITHKQLIPLFSQHSMQLPRSKRHQCKKHYMSASKCWIIALVKKMQ